MEGTTTGLPAHDRTHLDIGEFLTLAMPLLPRVNQGLICHILGAILGAIF